MTSIPYIEKCYLKKVFKITLEGLMQSCDCQSQKKSQESCASWGQSSTWQSSFQDCPRHSLLMRRKCEGPRGVLATRRQTPAECNYVQIEKELLAIIFGVERSHQYTYGRLVKVDSDKPLSSCSTWAST